MEQNVVNNDENKQIDYNEELVLYCADCLSLRIKNIPIMEDSDYYDSCGSTDIKKCNIEEWRSLYKQRYGHDYLETY